MWDKNADTVTRECSLISMIVSVAWVDVNVGVNGLYMFDPFFTFIINSRTSRVKLPVAARYSKTVFSSGPAQMCLRKIYTFNLCTFFFNEKIDESYNRKKYVTSRCIIVDNPFFYVSLIKSYLLIPLFAVYIILEF